MVEYIFRAKLYFYIVTVKVLNSYDAKEGKGYGNENVKIYRK